MAVAASDLLEPKGPVEEELFPGESETEITTRLNGFIAQGVTAASDYTWADAAAQDAGVKAYALYLTFRQAYTLSLLRPAEDDTQAEMLGKVSFTADQRKGIKDLSDWYYSEWEGLASATLSDPSNAAVSGIPSHRLPVIYDW